MIKGNILLVDDDKDIVESMEIHLKNEGLKVYKAYDGIEALEILLEKEIHLILMDIMMPRMDGLSATLKIREEKNIPIILVSAKTQYIDKIICFHNHPSGNTDFSKEYKVITNRLQKCGKILGIELVGHIIVGDNDRYFSFKENFKI